MEHLWQAFPSFFATTISLSPDLPRIEKGREGEGRKQEILTQVYSDNDMSSPELGEFKTDHSPGQFNGFF